MRGVQSPFGVEKGDAGAAQIALLAAVLVVRVHDDSDDLAAGVGVPGHAEGLSGVDAEHQPVGRRGRVGRKPEGIGKGVVTSDNAMTFNPVVLKTSAVRAGSCARRSAAWASLCAVVERSL